MKNKFLVTFIIVTFFIHQGFSQIRNCYSSEINKKAEQENPDALKAKTTLGLFTKNYLNNNSKTEEVYIIPVVFHVMHNYGGENISKAQILDAIRILNNDFRKLNPDTVDIIPEFTGISADSKIEFRLATIDPNGNCTDGIVRVATPGTYYGDESTKYESPAWPRNKYLNIWTVESIAMGAAGYSYYPSSVDGSWGEAVDGVMILYDYVGSFWPSSPLTSRTLTHEIGHYLNLMHTWGSSNEPGLLSNCDIDDEVSDTPNTIGHTSCNLYSVTCGSLDNVQNYMEYSYCYKMFTEGQKQRMRAALNSPISGRNNLWTPANLMATGTNDGAVAQTCFPMPDFSVSNPYGCNNLSVQYTDMTWNTDTITSRNWLFPGGSPSTSTALNPIINYSSAGQYDATLTVTNSNGTNQITRTSVVHVQDPLAGENIPWVEGFENVAFPNHPSDMSKSWEIIGDGSSQWQRVSGISFSGQACSAIENANNVAGQTSSMMSPNLILAGNNPGNTLKFKVAYAQKDANSTDKLFVFLSDNCGLTWSLRYNRSGVNLSTNGGNYENSFIPSASEWRQEIITLSSMQNKPHLRVKFVATSGNGNNIYIDDINLDQATSIENLSLSEKINLNIFPNPINSETRIIFDIPDKSKVSFTINNLIGKQLAGFSETFKEGHYDFLINEMFQVEIPAGIYFIRTTINGQSETNKLIKN